LTTETIEVGFDLTGSGGPFLRLDDPVSGQLDNFDWVLGGTLFYDISDRVRSYSISRGKTREFEGYQPGEAVIELDNRDRAFDPTFTASPFFGNIVPKRELRIYTNDEISFYGVVDDWNLEYDLSGDSTATVVTSDGMVFLNNQTLTASTATPQLSGARIISILDDPSVQWPATRRTIDPGTTNLGADVIEADTNVLDYLRLVEKTEQGSLFIGKDGNVVFKDTTVVALPTGVVHLSDDGTGIPYEEIGVVYGSEQLYNEVVVASVNTGSTAVATDADSQDAYGIFNYTATDLLMDTDEQLENYALYIASRYSQPEYRFETLTVRLNDLSTIQQADMLGLELGDVVKVTFTPNGIPPAIVTFCEVIKINHEVTVDGQHHINFGFSTIESTALVLDDEILGRLDADNALGQ
jgi:hypothetical protein